MKQTKIWGTTERLFAAAGVTVDRLEILAGSFCSEHRHARKVNLFICLKGQVVIRYWKLDGTPGSTVLDAPGSVLVAGGAWHQFRSGSGADVLEVCFAPQSITESEIDADIERRTEGGLV